MDKPKQLDSVKWGARLLALLTLLGGIARIVLISDADKRLDTTTLTYFGVAGALLVLERVKTLAFGETKIELREAKEKADQALEMAKTAIDTASVSTFPAEHADGESKRVLSEELKDLRAVADSMRPGKVKDDPWKGQFGGQAIRNGRILSARVTQIIDSEDYFLVLLSIDELPGSEVLRGHVQFFLHDSFYNDRPIV